MTRERVRAFLGVWMPLIIGASVILIAANFLLRTSEVPEGWPETVSWGVMRSACAGGLVFLGIVLLLSTAGRYRKTKEARAEEAPPRSQS